MWWLLLAIFLVGCSQQAPSPELGVEAAADESAQAPPETATSEPQPPLLGCTPPSLIIFGENGEYAVGIKRLTIKDMQGWYKITGADVWIRGPLWLRNDLTFEVREPQSSLGDFNRQLVPIVPNATCQNLSVALNIAVRNISSTKELTVILGEGQNRLGAKLVHACGLVNLAQYVE